MQEIEDDFYEILGVQEAANQDDIRKAYLKLAKKLHPDRFPNDPEKKAAAQQEFARVTRAHEVLSDPKQKDEYDAFRTLAKSRAALDISQPITAAQAAAAQGSGASAEAKAESKVEWAQKHATRAKEYCARKKFQEAETAIKEAIRLDPARTSYRVQLADIYLARGWKTLAMTEVQTALRLDPSDGDAKSMELKLKVAAKNSGKASDDKKNPSLMDQLKALLGKK
jgi:DnaJ-class molecular chaperone